MTRSPFAIAVLALIAAASCARAQQRDSAPTPACASCAEWNAPQQPFRLYGNTYFVGTHGLSAILVTSDSGHVLIDGALPESAAPIMANIAALGFRVSDVKLIVNSHAHFDHAGGIAAIQRASGAVVAASPPSARVIERGTSGVDDPQYGVLQGFSPVRRVRVIADGETLHVGPLALTAHFTPGHTPGGTSWSWTSCDAGRCLAMVYADSQTPVSADGFFYTHSSTYPNALQDFARGQALLEQLPCDILITPHPGASAFFARLAGKAPLVNPQACVTYAEAGQAALEKRIKDEGGAK
jgi:metallo-beta-lactamase class B